MAKSVTVNFDDGTSHTYDNVPDEVSDDEVSQRAGSEFGDKTITGVTSGGGAAPEAGGEGSVAPKELSVGEKVAGGVATAASLAMQHPAVPAAAVGLYKANKVANTYIAGKEAETAALNQRTAQQAETAAAHQNIQQQKIDLKKAQMGTGQQPYKFTVDPQTGAGKLSMNQPSVTPQQQVTPQMGQPQAMPQAQPQMAPQAGPAVPQQAPQAAPMAQQAAKAAPQMEGVLGQARNVVQKLALGKVLKGAGMVGAAYEIGSNLFHTSPEEIEILKRQEAAKRAQGWKPLNER